MDGFVVTVGLVLFPGVLATIVADKTAVHVRQWGSAKYFLYSYVFGILCYAVLQMVVFLASYAWNVALKGQFDPSLAWSSLGVWGFASGNAPITSAVEVVGASALAAPVGLLAALLFNRKCIHRLARRIGVSKKYGDETLYNYFLNSKEADCVYVRDWARDLAYKGRVHAYSDNGRMAELVMTDVTVYEYSSGNEFYSVPRLYWSRAVGHFSIEVIPIEDEEVADG